MTSPASTSGTANGTSLTIDQIVTAMELKTQLQTLWKSVDPSGFVPATNKGVLKALLQHICHHTADSAALDGQAMPVSPPVCSPAVFPPLSGFVSRKPQPRKLTPSFEAQDCFKIKTYREHEQKMQQHSFRLEEIDRLTRQNHLIAYNVPEGDTKFDQTWEEAWRSIPEEVRKTFAMHPREERLGRRSPDKHRPVRIKFDTQAGKHGLLHYTSEFRQHGINFDDDLTRMQQSDWKALDKDFAVLKAKGQMPFFRGSVLKYFHSNMMHTCREGKANKAPLAE